MKRRRLRYNRRKIFLGLFLFLCLIGITLGYAFVTTRLSIDGTATVKDAKWNVHFDNFAPMTGSVSPESSPTITNTTVTFSARLSQPGDFYGFTIDIENEGTINADISSISVTPNFSNIDYIDASIKYSDNTPISNGDILAANHSRTIKVYLEYLEGLADNLYPATDQVISVTVSIYYEQYTGKVGTWTLPQGKTNSNLTSGDELCLEDQCFNFIAYDNEDAVLLAKYNLNVGSNAKGDETFLQDSDVRGEYEDITTYGTVSVSELPYITNVEEVYDENHAGAPGESNYSLTYYVVRYRNKLINDYGALIKGTRLLFVSEAVSMGCSINDLNGSCPTTGDGSFITNTSFWLGTAYSDERVYNIRSSGSVYASFNVNNTHLGVRPVIIINKDNI